MYSHWFEHIFANMTTIVAGPLLMGVHVSVWMAWSFISTTTFTLGHTGWHLPLIPHSPEVHDFHHSQGWANLGSFTGLLDAVFGSDEPYLQAWQSKLKQIYSSPDYPVDKVLARHDGETPRRWYTQPNSWTVLGLLEQLLRLTSPS